MTRDNLMENGRKIGAHLRARLAQAVAVLGVLGEVRGTGCLACVELVRDMKTRESFPADRLFGKRVEKRLIEAGLILRCDPNWISFAPPLITTREQADEMIEIFLGCLKQEISAEGL